MCVHMCIKAPKGVYKTSVYSTFAKHLGALGALLNISLLGLCKASRGFYTYT